MEELFRTAVARQTDIMVQNILGNGIDIPLLGLREASLEVEGDYHELFTDDTYKIAQCFMLSTSQVTFFMEKVSLRFAHALFDVSLTLIKHKFPSTLN